MTVQGAVAEVSAAATVSPDPKAETPATTSQQSRRRRRRHQQSSSNVNQFGASKKRGIALNTWTAAKIRSAKGMASWGYNWNFRTWRVSATKFDKNGVDFIPIVGNRHHARRINEVHAQGIRAIFGFNEPNFRSQANMSPKKAAYYWPRIEKLARDNNIRTVVGPAVNFNSRYHPVRWYKDFLKACKNCRVDAIAVHIYGCKLGYYINTLNMYKKAFPGKKIWITEIACGDFPRKRHYGTDEQIALMRKLLPVLENDPMIEGYAWFAVRNSWASTRLFHTDGRLTRLGRFYKSFPPGR